MRDDNAALFYLLLFRTEHQTQSATQLIFSPAFSLEVLDIAAECLLPEYPSVCGHCSPLTQHGLFMSVLWEGQCTTRAKAMQEDWTQRWRCCFIQRCTNLLIPCWLVRWQVRRRGFICQRHLTGSVCAQLCMFVCMHIGEGVCFELKHVS